MSEVDVWALSAAIVAGVALGLRGCMLKPRLNTWPSGPNAVAVGLLLLSIAMGCAAVSILNGSHANAREALVYSALAGVSLVMLWNLNRQRADRAGREAHDRSEPSPI